jgi:hypothetical protein
VPAANSRGVSKRNEGLYELNDDDWGVQVASDSQAEPPQAVSKKGALKALHKARQRNGQQQQQQQMGQEGLISLAMLQQTLEGAGEEPLTEQDIASIKKQMALEANGKTRSKVPAMPNNAEMKKKLQELRAKHKAANARRNLDAEEEEDELLDGPDYQLTLGENGAVSYQKRSSTNNYWNAICTQWQRACSMR